MTSQSVRVAAVQAEPVVLDRDATVAKACRLIAEAAKTGARLIVFPETFIPTYVNGRVWGRALSTFGTDRARRAFTRLWDQSVEIGSATTEQLGRAAREAGAVVVMGLNERVAGTLYNSLLFLGPDGNVLGVHRKLMPTNHERMIWAMGDGSTLKVFDTPVGRIGGLICWENWMPLARYALYAQGEQIHVAPTADDGEMAAISARHIAFEGRVFVISVCMILRRSSYPSDFELADELAGTGDLLESGGSVIAGPDGKLLAGPLQGEEGILYADLDLGRLIGDRQLLDVTGHYARPDVLQLVVDTTPREPVATRPLTSLR
jgi:nitrilase